MSGLNQPLETIEINKNAFIVRLSNMEGWVDVEFETPEYSNYYSVLI